jgi:hypothetical protein
MGISEHQNYFVGRKNTQAAMIHLFVRPGRRGKASGRFACLACAYSLNVLEVADKSG